MYLYHVTSSAEALIAAEQGLDGSGGIPLSAAQVDFPVRDSGYHGLIQIHTNVLMPWRIFPCEHYLAETRKTRWEVLKNVTHEMRAEYFRNWNQMQNQQRFYKSSLKKTGRVLYYNDIPSNLINSITLVPRNLLLLKRYRGSLEMLDYSRNGYLWGHFLALLARSYLTNTQLAEAMFLMGDMTKDALGKQMAKVRSLPIKRSQ